MRQHNIGADLNALSDRVRKRNWIAFVMDLQSQWIFISVYSPHFVKVTQFDLMYLLVPVLETLSDRGKVSPDDFDVPKPIQALITR